MNVGNTIGIVGGQLLRMIPSILILVGCLVYLMRSKRGEGVVCLIGNVGTLLLSLATTGMTLMMVRGAMDHMVMAKLSVALQILYFLFGLTFAVGFLMIAQKARPD